MELDLRRGIRNVDVQPAPRIRRSTVGWVVVVVLGINILGLLDAEWLPR